MAISVRPSRSATFLPRLSMSGPTETEAITRPIACASAMVASCASVSGNVGINVPSMAAITPYTKSARLAARIACDPYSISGAGRRTERG